MEKLARRGILSALLAAGAGAALAADSGLMVVPDPAGQGPAAPAAPADPEAAGDALMLGEPKDYLIRQALEHYDKALAGLDSKAAALSAKAEAAKKGSSQTDTEVVRLKRKRSLLRSKRAIGLYWRAGCNDLAPCAEAATEFAQASVDDSTQPLALWGRAISRAASHKDYAEGKKSLKELDRLVAEYPECPLYHESRGMMRISLRHRLLGIDQGVHPPPGAVGKLAGADCAAFARRSHPETWVHPNCLSALEDSGQAALSDWAKKRFESARAANDRTFTWSYAQPLHAAYALDPAYGCLRKPSPGLACGPCGAGVRHWDRDQKDKAILCWCADAKGVPDPNAGDKKCPKTKHMVLALKQWMKPFRCHLRSRPGEIILAEEFPTKAAAAEPSR